MSLIGQSCDWTCIPARGFVAGMDNEKDLIRQLCTQAGCIMENASVVALIWDDDLALETRLRKLCKAAADIQMLIAAATALMIEPTDQ